LRHFVKRNVDVIGDYMMIQCGVGHRYYICWWAHNLPHIQCPVIYWSILSVQSMHIIWWNCLPYIVGCWNLSVINMAQNGKYHESH